MQSARQLWKLPVFALVAPPTMLACAALLRSQLLLGAFWFLGALAPILGLATLAILAFQYMKARRSVESGRRSGGVMALLGALAVVSPVWLWVMFLVATGFNR